MEPITSVDNGHDEPCLRTETTGAIKRANSRDICRVGQALEKREVKDMLTKIADNDKSTVIFKVKNHIKSDITSEVLNSVMNSFHKNTVCEAVYFQNLGHAMQDEQIVRLIRLLQYCTVSLEVPSPPSPGSIPDHTNAEVVGNLVDENARVRRRPVLFEGSETRRGRTCHRCDKPVDSNFPDKFWNQTKSTCRCRPIWCINVGECDYISTSTWVWFCEQLEFTSVTHMYVSEHIISADLKTKMRDVIRRNRAKHRFHNDEHNLDVIQRCTNCWWNPINSIKHAEQQKINMKIQAQEERKRKIQEARDEARRLREAERERERAKLQRAEDRRLAKEVEKEALRRATLDVTALDESHVEYWYYKTHRPDLLARGKGNKRTKKSYATEAEAEAAAQKAKGYWRFECNCGEVCTSYENFRYHPTGLMFECSNLECFHWAHAKCVFGQKTTQESLDAMKTTYCPKCLTKRRRQAAMLGRTSITAAPEVETSVNVAVEPSVAIVLEAKSAVVELEQPAEA